MSLVPRYCQRCGGPSGHLICPKPQRELDLLSLPEFPPIPVMLFCPVCDEQHIDAPNPAIHWTNPPHKSHLCLFCGNIWRPCDLATTGVKEVTTRGKADTWPPDRDRMHRWQTDQDETRCLDCYEKFDGNRNQYQFCSKRMPAAKMDAPGGPVCWCGKPSAHESGWCGGSSCSGFYTLMEGDGGLGLKEVAQRLYDSLSPKEREIVDRRLKKGTQ